MSFKLNEEGVLVILDEGLQLGFQGRCCEFEIACANKPLT
jgi:hypothetical protein